MITKNQTYNVTILLNITNSFILLISKMNANGMPTGCQLISATMPQGKRLETVKHPRGLFSLPAAHMDVRKHVASGRNGIIPCNISIIQIKNTMFRESKHGVLLLTACNILHQNATHRGYHVSMCCIRCKRSQMMICCTLGCGLVCQYVADCIDMCYHTYPCRKALNPQSRKSLKQQIVKASCH